MKHAECIPIALQFTIFFAILVQHPGVFWVLAQCYPVHVFMCVCLCICTNWLLPASIMFLATGNQLSVHSRTSLT